MANANKAKGTRWESAVRDFLKEERCLDHARRIAQTGTLDIGDIHMEPFVIQAKNQKSFDLAGWVADAEVQAERAPIRECSHFALQVGGERFIGQGNLTNEVVQS